MSEHAQPADDLTAKIVSSNQRDPLVMTLDEAAHAHANLNGRIAEFRADVFGGLLPIEPPEKGYAWAAYRIGDEIEDDFSAVAEIDRAVGVLILSTDVFAEVATGPPLIRVITQEFLKANENGNLFVTDTSVYPDNDVQYLVDASDFEDATTLSMTYAPYFNVLADNHLHLHLPADTTLHVGCHVTTDGVKHTVAPFGKFDTYRDRLYAIERTQALINDLKLLKPKAVGIWTEDS